VVVPTSSDRKLSIEAVFASKLALKDRPLTQVVLIKKDSKTRDQPPVGLLESGPQQATAFSFAFSTAN
jgi:hypothetical protein